MRAALAPERRRLRRLAGRPARLPGAQRSRAAPLPPPADEGRPARPRAREPAAGASGAGWRRGWAGPLFPLALLLLPDRHTGLDLVDDLARASERLVAVWRGRRDHHR